MMPPEPKSEFFTYLVVRSRSLLSSFSKRSTAIVDTAVEESVGRRTCTHKEAAHLVATALVLLLVSTSCKCRAQRAV